MSALPSVINSHWYRVARLVPRLQPGAHIQRQMIRGQEWFVLTHPHNGRHYRLTRNAYELVGRFNGYVSVDALWRMLRETQGDHAPTQDEALHIMARLTDAGLLISDRLADLRILQEAHDARIQQERANMLNPLAFRLKLFNPTRLLDKLGSIEHSGYGATWLIGWLFFVMLGAMQALTDWHSLRAFAAEYWLTPRCFALTWLIYPFMKTFHELGHALMVRRYGGQVEETGISLFLLLPAPYVDASAASAFPNKWQRAAVGAAGIMVELALASAGVLVWALAEPGWIKEMAFTVAMIGSLSTLIFNGNPLLRFDGYYVLTDVFELPNLATRSRQLWAVKLRRLFFGIKDPMPRSDTSWSENLWLLLYGPASAVYRLVISIAIVTWIAGKSTALAMLAGVTMLYLLLLRPVLRGIDAANRGQARPHLMRFTVILTLIACALNIPLPHHTVAPAVVWLPDQALVRAQTNGRIAKIYVRDGQAVQPGDKLISIDNPDLFAQHNQLLAQIRAAQTEQIGTWQTDPTRARNLIEDIARLQNELVEVQTQMAHTLLRAETSGIVSLPHPDEWIGRDILKGAILARVINPQTVMVRAIVPQDDIGRIRNGVRDLSIRFAGLEDRSFSAQLIRTIPAATRLLPNAVLGDKFGGPYATDPTDPDGLMLQETAFVLDAQLHTNGKEFSPNIGTRAWVALNHPPTPLLQRWLRSLEQAFLRHLSVEKR